MSSRENRLESYCIAFCITAATFVGVVSPTLLADPQSKAPETKFDPKRPKTHGALLRGGERIPSDGRLRDYLKKKKYKTLTLINPQGQVRIVDLFGVDVAPCGQVEGTEIIGNCKISKRRVGKSVEIGEEVSVIGSKIAHGVPSNAISAAPGPCEVAGCTRLRATGVVMLLISG